MTTPGSELKFGRAERHLQEVHDLLRSYLNPEPYAIRRDEDPNTGLTFWITLQRKPPAEIALAAGDCIHNLRSALDHIIYELSCHHMHQAHVKGTAFPIFQNPDSWAATDKMRISHQSDQSFRGNPITHFAGIRSPLGRG